MLDAEQLTTLQYHIGLMKMEIKAQDTRPLFIRPLISIFEEIPSRNKKK